MQDYKEYIKTFFAQQEELYRKNPHTIKFVDFPLSKDEHDFLNLQSQQYFFGFFNPNYTPPILPSIDKEDEDTELEPKEKKKPKTKKCTCSIIDLMKDGCNCGSIKKYLPPNP